MIFILLGYESFSLIHRYVKSSIFNLGLTKLRAREFCDGVKQPLPVQRKNESVIADTSKKEEMCLAPFRA